MLDANIPRCAIAVVERRGWQSLFERDMFLGSARDEVIAHLAQQNDAVLVTRDCDFSDIRNYPPADYPGIVVFDAPQHAAAPYICALLEAFLQRPDIEMEIRHRLASVRADRVRFSPNTVQRMITMASTNDLSG